MAQQWQIMIHEGNWYTSDGFLHRVSLGTEDSTVAIFGTVFKNRGDAETFGRMIRDEFLLPEEIGTRLIRAISRRLWASHCQSGGDGIVENIELESFLQDEFGGDGRMVLEYMQRTARTFELLCD
jgi:hypothetical protein